MNNFPLNIQSHFTILPECGSITKDTRYHQTKNMAIFILSEVSDTNIDINLYFGRKYMSFTSAHFLPENTMRLLFIVRLPRNRTSISHYF